MSKDGLPYHKYMRMYENCAIGLLILSAESDSLS